MISDAPQSEEGGTSKGVYDLLKKHLTTNGIVYLPAQIGNYDGTDAEVQEAKPVSFKAVAELGNFDKGEVAFLCTSYHDEEVVIVDAVSTVLTSGDDDKEIPVLVLDLESLAPGKRGVTRARFTKYITSGKGRSWLSFSQPETPPEKVEESEAEWKPPVRHKRDFVALDSKIDFENELNEEQFAAVKAPDGPTLVIAAAGTGKTRTLIYRLAYLATQKKVHPDHVLLLTFTNKAAREMLERTHQLVGNQFGSYDSGTFHSFANRVLRAGANRLGFGRDFTILDSDDAKKLMRTCIDDIGVSKKHFPKPEVLLSLFGVESGRMGDLNAAIDEEFEYSDVEADDVIKAHNLYQQKKKESNAMDFDDLLIYAHKLLLEHEDIRHHYQEEFKYVLVDEYQDTNAIQAKLVHLLVETHGNLMVVGDDFQSIYSWRGADFRNFLEFEKTYPGTQIFKLQTNYRSTPEILDVANEVIAGNPDQFQKELQAVRDSDVLPKLAKVRDGSVQARYVIEKANELRRKGLALADMCVLYRSHFHAMELEMELNRAGMAYSLTSGVRFFEKAHIKDVCSTLQLLVNPANELAFSRLVQLFPKVGSKTASKIFKKLGGRVNLQRPEVCAEVLKALPAAAKEDWEKIQDIFVAYREENLSNDPGEIIFRFVKTFYKEYMVENFDNHKFRQEDIDGLIDVTVKFESTESFLQEIALLTNMDGGNAPAEEEQRDAIRMSTVHQAKGLEWKAVFILFVNEDMFPSKKSVEENGDAEERRLFYVAVTRAEDELFICSPMVRRQRDGGMIFLDPSRFISEIPDDLLQEDGELRRSTSIVPAYKAPSRPFSEPNKPDRRELANAQPEVEEEKTKAITVSLSVPSMKFEDGSVTLSFSVDDSDLPGLRCERKMDIVYQDSYLKESLQHMISYLAKAKGSNAVAAEIEFEYKRRTILKKQIVSTNLIDFLINAVPGIQTQAIDARLKELANEGRDFVSPEEVIPGIMDLVGVKTENEFLSSVSSNYKHGKQIHWLAENHISLAGKLRLGTDNSVLTLLVGSSGCYFVWEMLNEGNATYLWSTGISFEDLSSDDDLFERTLAVVESKLSFIRSNGKETYIGLHENGFFRIYHKSDGDGDGICGWKDRMKDRINSPDSDHIS